MNPKQKSLQAKLRLSEKEERKGEAFTFSPGPSQVVSTQMKKLIDEEIRQRVEDELKKLGGNPKKEVASSVSKAVARKSFLSPDSEEEVEDEDEATQFRKRIQKTFEADELKRQDEALKKKKKEWYDEQQRVKKIEEEIKRLEQEKQKVSNVQLFSQEDSEEPQDDLHTWCMKNEQDADDEKVKSSGSKDKDDELSTKEMLKILMKSQERTMEIALKATVSPSKKRKRRGFKA